MCSVKLWVLFAWVPFFRVENRMCGKCVGVHGGYTGLTSLQLAGSTCC